MSLNKNESICVLPWISVDRNQSLDKNISLSPCCLYETKETYTQIEKYWNSEELVNLRQQMIDGVKPAGCHKCWHNESQGLDSLRKSVNKGNLDQYKDRLTSAVCSDNPTQVKYTVGNQCNLACRMCIPQYSSRVGTVWKNIGKNFSIYRDEFDYESYILQNIDSINFIDIIGGEPFYNNKTQKFLQKIISTGCAEKIKLHACTNATRIDQNLIYLLKQFKECVISVSIDATGNLYEYIRPGADWQKLCQNIDMIQENSIQIQIAPTLSVYNILNFKDLIEWSKQRNYVVSQPAVVYNPVELAPYNLPLPLHKYVDDDLMHQSNEKNIEKDCLPLIIAFDKQWQTNICKVIPQWKEVFESPTWHDVDDIKNDINKAKSYVN